MNCPLLSLEGRKASGESHGLLLPFSWRPRSIRMGAGLVHRWGPIQNGPGPDLFPLATRTARIRWKRAVT